MHRSLHTRLGPLLWIALACSGCASEGSGPDVAFTGGQTGSEGDDCIEVERVPLAEDELGPLGFSAAEVLARVAGPHALSLRYEDGSETGVTLELTARGAPAHVRYERNPERMEEILIACDAQLELPVTLLVESGDGALVETLDARLDAVAVDDARTHTEVAVEALMGSYAARSVDASDWDTLSLALSLRFTAGAVDGELSERATRQDGADTDPDGTASAHRAVVATLR